MHGTKSKKAHFLVDNLGLGARNIGYYTDKDLAIGAVINALGRAFTLTRCDKFTQQYYKERYGVGENLFTEFDLANKRNPSFLVPCLRLIFPGRGLHTIGTLKSRIAWGTPTSPDA